ncbi:SDR family NAD(P)-dependent oxidoreductase [Sphingopyxis sp.]|uniref:SDR family NAD(P)-dependent oxidoreductase n=1 Tax=Sphingopyxis sp. TaxID=1908224 RepID=UPI002D781288|nr:SDR family NAD(P)-dependent oxidoreductase [Sphingopyxis sp.]HET6523121.1 SDR family NAD(P)-dependent oxidoreductase [Sphingopyxis sp.]
MRFEGKVALITGGASGIGKTTAIRIAREGATCVIGDIQMEAADSVAAEINANGGSAIAMKLDIAREDEWNTVIADIVHRHGKLDVLVNNAAIGDLDTIEDTSLETYNKVIAVTQTSVFLGTKAASAALKASGNGAIVNVSSIWGMIGGFGDSPAYSSAKGAIRNFTKVAAMAWAKEKVRVNSVHPGFIDTPVTQGMDQAMFAEMTPLGRMGTTDEVAAVILFLASDEASYVTGSEFVVDGGYIAR